MSAKLQWVVRHVDGASVLTCGHQVAGVRPLGAEAHCDQCMWWFTGALDQEIAAAEEGGHGDHAA